VLIISRYFLREFLRVLVLCLATFIALYLIGDLFSRIEDILERGVGFGLVVQYFICGLPRIIHQLCPLAVLLSTFITIGLFVRNQEITALKAHGISLYRVLNVFILISAGIFVVSLLMQQYLIPKSTARFNQIRQEDIRGKKRSKLVDTTAFWYRAKDGIYNIDFFDPKRNTLDKVSIIYLDDVFQAKKAIYAETGKWNGKSWVLYNGMERRFLPDGGQTATAFKQQPVSLHATPEDFYISRKDGDELSFTDLWRLLKQLRTSGYPSTSYAVDLQSKVSYSFINIIMAILGIPFALMIGRSGNMALGIAVSICLGLTYWVFFSFCISLGKGGVLNPFIAAWIANITFGMLGVYLFLRVRQ
jgi:lipopolysaccharide export system permease protein